MYKTCALFKVQYWQFVRGSSLVVKEREMTTSIVWPKILPFQRRSERSQKHKNVMKISFYSLLVYMTTCRAMLNTRWFPAAILVPIQTGTSMVSPYKSAINLGKKVSLHTFHKKTYCDLNLGESLYIFRFFLFPDSGLNLLNVFHLYFYLI